MIALFHRKQARTDTPYPVYEDYRKRGERRIKQLPLTRLMRVRASTDRRKATMERTK